MSVGYGVATSDQAHRSQHQAVLPCPQRATQQSSQISCSSACPASASWVLEWFKGGGPAMSVVRAGSGKLHSRYKWNFCLTLA